MNNLYRIIAVALSLSISSVLTCYAQSQVSRDRSFAEIMPVIDMSKLECVYSYMQYDADLDHEQPMDDILQVGKKYLRYMRYGTYRADSVTQHMDKDKLNSMTWVEHHNEILVKNGWQGLDCILVELASRELKHIVPTGGRYKEKIPSMTWRYVEGDTTVLGLKCRKAVCDFRGLEWTVWYCPEIKVPYGPWKLNGLPGLILLAYDKSGAHSYEAIGIRTKPSEIYLLGSFNVPKYISREECARRHKDHCMTFCKGMWDAYNEDPVNNSRPAFRHLPYVPHELE